MDTHNFGFDPAEFTAAPLQTEGWIRFTQPASQVFAQLANHEGMTEWVPLLKKVAVSHPPGLAPGENGVGVTRTLDFQGGVRLIETIVYWRGSLCYAYDTRGDLFPLQDYIGFMGVDSTAEEGGRFVFCEYFNVSGRVAQAVVPHGVALTMKRAFHKLSQLIGGIEYEVNHVGQH